MASLFWTPCPQDLFNVFWLFSGSPTKSTVFLRAALPTKGHPFIGLDFWAYAAWNAGCLLGGMVGDTLSIPDTSLGFSLTALFVILVIEQWRAHRTMLPIAVSILAWFAVASFGSNLSVGMTILSVMSFAMISFAVIHWWQRLQPEGKVDGTRINHPAMVTAATGG